LGFDINPETDVFSSNDTLLSTSCLSAGDLGFLFEAFCICDRQSFLVPSQTRYKIHHCRVELPLGLAPVPNQRFWEALIHAYPLMSTLGSNPIGRSLSHLAPGAAPECAPNYIAHGWPARTAAAGAYHLRAKPQEGRPTQKRESLLTARGRICIKPKAVNS